MIEISFNELLLNENISIVFIKSSLKTFGAFKLRAKEEAMS